MVAFASKLTAEVKFDFIFVLSQNLTNLFKFQFMYFANVNN